MNGAMIIAIALTVLGCGGGGRADRTAAQQPPRVSDRWLIFTSERARATYLSTPRLALQPDGSGLIGVQGAPVDPASCRTRDRDRAFVAPVDGEGRIGWLVALDSNLDAGPVALPGDRSVAMVTEPQPGSTDCEPVDRVLLADLGARGRQIARRELVRRVESLWDAQIAAGPDGALSLAWIEVAADTTSTLRAAVRAADGTLSRPVTLAQGDGVVPQGPFVTDAALAVTREGITLVAYAAQGDVRVSTLDRAGRVARDDRVGAADAITDVDVAAGAGGRAVVVWGGQDGGEERERPYRVFAASRAHGATRFGPPQRLDPGGSVDSVDTAPLVVLDARGRALVAWENIEGEAYPAYIARAEPGGRFGDRVLVSGVGRLADAALGPGGRAVVVLHQPRDGSLYAIRVPGGRAERITRDAAYSASIAFTPRGTPLVGWSAGPENRPFVRIARRRGA